MRLLRYLVLFALVAFVVWPYYHIFRIDNALGRGDMQALEQFLDVPAIRRNYKERLERGLGLRPELRDTDDMARMRQNLQRLGDVALERTITPEWVRDTLRQAAAAATDARAPYFMGAVTFAFFDSYDRFLIRLGRLGRDASHVRMGFRDWTWRITDIIR